MTDEQKPTDTKASEELNDAHRHAEPKGGSGEDEGSTAKEGDEDHLHEDQKTTSR